MFTHNKKRLSAIALVSALAVAAVDARPTPFQSVVRRGVGSGAWDLPTSSAGQGTVDGIFFIPNIPNSSMHFIGTLTDVSSPCLSCIEGTLQGTLDDGIGSGPDYIVDGTYFGGWFSGKGSWTATIYPANSPQPTPVGRIRGIFDDPPPNAGPGTFSCRWIIND